MASLSPFQLPNTAHIRPYVAPAQSSATIRRIGFLGNSTPELEANLIGPFRRNCVRLDTKKGETSTSNIAGPMETTVAFRNSFLNCYLPGWRSL
jgi:hypothetical protein